jgi:hypothetical protein
MATVTPRQQTARATIPAKCIGYMKRLGVVGFLFFLVKGLLWLVVPALLVYFR